jgi:hypothetical protein
MQSVRSGDATAPSRYDRNVPDSVLVDELANELDTWPGVRIERPSESVALVFYEDVELGSLDRDGGTAQLRFSLAERDELVEHGDADSAAAMPESDVSHSVNGPSDVTAVLELFDRRYRDLRGEDEPYSSEDPA